MKQLLILLIAFLSFSCEKDDIIKEDSELFYNKIAEISTVWKPSFQQDDKVLFDVYSDNIERRFSYHIYRNDIDCYVTTNYLELNESEVIKHNTDTLLIAYYKDIDNTLKYEFTYEEPELILKGYVNDVQSGGIAKFLSTNIDLSTLNYCQ